jgi:hypothetical protein
MRGVRVHDDVLCFLLVCEGSALRNERRYQHVGELHDAVITGGKIFSHTPTKEGAATNPKNSDPGI